MSYQALYRKFRPADFSEVRGQDHVVTTLKNQLAAGRVGHAYIFSGTRGTGKTSVAKIFARALNCEAPKDGNPCGECDSCKKIAQGATFSVQEVDGASNNGVDNIRAIIEDVSYPPIDSKYKVYIIDEAHMVTKAAFNALLKTIEEPPEYAVFILATTEVNAIPPTILSRCQRYDFRRITLDEITDRMGELVTQEGISIEDRALRYIARLADGSLRDALSILDQCASFYYGKDITFDMTLKMLGNADNEIFSRLFRAIVVRDARTALDIAEETVIRGVEPETFVLDFTWYLRNLLLVKCGERLEDVADISGEDAAAFLEEIDIADEDFIMRSISVFSELLAQLRYSPVKRISLEIGVVRLCRPQMDQDYPALLERVKMLEEGISLPPTQPIRQNNPSRDTEKRPAPVQQLNSAPTPAPEPPPWDEAPPDDSPWEASAPSGNAFMPPDDSPWEDAKPLGYVPEPASVENYEQPITAKEAPREKAAETHSDTGDWNRFIKTLRGPDFMANKGVLVPTDESSGEIYVEKGSTAEPYYNDERAVARLSKMYDAFTGRHMDLSVVFVSADRMPSKKTESEKPKPTTSQSEDFLKKMQDMGIPVEIQE